MSQTLVFTRYHNTGKQRLQFGSTSISHFLLAWRKNTNKRKNHSCAFSLFQSKMQTIPFKDQRSKINLLLQRVQNVPNSTSLLITHDRIVQYHLKVGSEIRLQTTAIKNQTTISPFNRYTIVQTTTLNKNNHRDIGILLNCSSDIAILTINDRCNLPET